MFAAKDVTHGSICVVSRPGIPHAGGEAEKVARLSRRMGCIDADGGQSSFIPHASNAVGSRAANANIRAACQKQKRANRRQKSEAWLVQRMKITRQAGEIFLGDHRTIYAWNLPAQRD